MIKGGLEKGGSAVSSRQLNSFHPETVLFPFGGVNLHNYSSPY